MHRDIKPVWTTFDDLCKRLAIMPWWRDEVFALSLRTGGRWQGERIAKAWDHIKFEKHLEEDPATYPDIRAPAAQWRVIGLDGQPPEDTP